MRITRSDVAMRVLKRLLLLVLLFCALTAAAAEQKCVEFDSQSPGRCLCSETLDTDKSNYTMSASGQDLNPGNSTTKQCGNNGWAIETALNQSGFGNVLSYLTTPAETSMPAGNVVDKIFRYQWPLGTSTPTGTMAVYSSTIPSSSHRMCSRYYFKVSADQQCDLKYSDVNYDCEMQVTSGGYYEPIGSGRIQLRIDPCYTGSASAANTPTGMYPDPNIDHNDIYVHPQNECVNNWCRIEQCIGGNIKANPATNMKASLYVTQVGIPNPNEWHVTELDVGSSNGDGVIQNLIRAMFLVRYDNRSGSGNGFCNLNATRDHSYFMAASWDTDSGQTIGPAYEVEGGAGTPSVPPAPVLQP